MPIQVGQPSTASLGFSRRSGNRDRRTGYLVGIAQQRSDQRHSLMTQNQQFYQQAYLDRMRYTAQQSQLQQQLQSREGMFAAGEQGESYRMGYDQNERNRRALLGELGADRRATEANRTRIQIGRMGAQERQAAQQPADPRQREPIGVPFAEDAPPAAAGQTHQVEMPGQGWGMPAMPQPVMGGYAAGGQQSLSLQEQQQANRRAAELGRDFPYPAVVTREDRDTAYSTRRGAYHAARRGTTEEIGERATRYGDLARALAASRRVRRDEETMSSQRD